MRALLSFCLFKRVFFFKVAIPKRHSKGGQKWGHTSLFLSNVLCASSIFHKHPSRDQKTKDQRKGTCPVNEGTNLTLEPGAWLPGHRVLGQSQCLLTESLSDFPLLACRLLPWWNTFSSQDNPNETSTPSSPHSVSSEH